MDLPAAVAPPPPSPQRALLVSGDAVQRALGRRLLEARGFAVEEALDGAQALVALARATFTVVLLDCRLEPLDAGDVARGLREREAGEARERSAVFAVVRGGLGEDRARYLAAGVDDCLAQPSLPADLDRALASWIPLPGAEAAVPALDAAYLETLCDPGDPGFFRELARLYLADVAPRLQRLEGAVEAGDEDGVRRAAHELRGASSAVGAAGLATLLREVEIRVRAPDGTAARRALLQRIRREMDRVASALAATLER